MGLPRVQLLFDHPRLLVANKPGGVLTQAPPGIDSLELRVKQHLVKLGSTDERPYVGVPHRLDRPVSGAIVIGKDKPSTRNLASQFEKRTVSKTYWAVLEGDVAPDSGRWVDYMRKIPDMAKSTVVAEDSPGAQEAILEYELLGKEMGFSWIRIKLQTGRTHQIRLQTSSRKHPIIGDSMYDAKMTFGPQTKDLRARWIGLHARQLSFQIPDTDDGFEAIAPLPECWNNMINLFPAMETTPF